jgi:hypothetical protein
MLLSESRWWSRDADASLWLQLLNRFFANCIHRHRPIVILGGSSGGCVCVLPRRIGVDGGELLASIQQQVQISNNRWDSRCCCCWHNSMCSCEAHHCLAMPSCCLTVSLFRRLPSGGRSTSPPCREPTLPRAGRQTRVAKTPSRHRRSETSRTRVTE